MTFTVQCPTCQRKTLYTTDNPFRPFCCERCKLIDLGAWADGSHCIAGESIAGEGIAGEAIDVYSNSPSLSPDSDPE